MSAQTPPRADPASSEHRHGFTKVPLPALAGGGAVLACVASGAVLGIQALIVWRSKRPAVPGPHPQDGLVPAVSDNQTPLNLVWLGDSLASGVGADTPDASFPRKAAATWYACEGRSVNLTNLARPGACARDVLAHQVPAALCRLGPGAVAIVTVGSNDVGSFTRPGRFRHEYGSILSSLSASGATVAAIGLPHLGSAAVMARPLRTIVGWVGRHADHQIRKLARAHGAYYVHIAIRAPWGTKPRTYLAADKWHPNDATYELWAERVVARVRPVVAASATPLTGTVALAETGTWRGTDVAGGRGQTVSRSSSKAAATRRIEGASTPSS